MNKNISRLTVDEKSSNGNVHDLSASSGNSGIRLRAFLCQSLKKYGQQGAIAENEANEIRRTILELGLESELIDRYLNVGFRRREKR